MAVNPPAQSPRVEMKEARHMKIPLFYGRPDGKEEIVAEDLVERIEALLKATGKSTDTAVNEFYLVLRDDAVKWFKALTAQGVDNKSWDAVKKQFIADYKFKISGSVAYKLEALKQKSNEKVLDFFSRVNEEIEHFMEGVGVNWQGSTSAQAVRSHFQKAIFIAGLREELKTNILTDEKARKDLTSAKTAAQTMEYVHLAKGRTTPGNPVMAMKEMEDEIDQIGQDDAEEEEEEMHDDEITDQSIPQQDG